MCDPELAYPNSWTWTHITVDCINYGCIIKKKKKKQKTSKYLTKEGSENFTGFPWFGLCSNGEAFNLSTFSGHPVAHLSRETSLSSIL